MTTASLRRVEARPNARLLVEFSDGVTGEIDLSSRLFGPMFEPLRLDLAIPVSRPERAIQRPTRDGPPAARTVCMPGKRDPLPARGTAGPTRAPASRATGTIERAGAPASRAGGPARASRRAGQPRRRSSAACQGSGRRGQGSGAPRRGSGEAWSPLWRGLPEPRRRRPGRRLAAAGGLASAARGLARRAGGLASARRALLGERTAFPAKRSAVLTEKEAARAERKGVLAGEPSGSSEGRAFPREMGPARTDAGRVKARGEGLPREAHARPSADRNAFTAWIAVGCSRKLVSSAMSSPGSATLASRSWYASPEST